MSAPLLTPSFSVTWFPWIITGASIPTPGCGPTSKASSPPEMSGLTPLRRLSPSLETALRPLSPPITISPTAPGKMRRLRPEHEADRR